MRAVLLLLMAALCARVHCSPRHAWPHAAAVVASASYSSASASASPNAPSPSPPQAVCASNQSATSAPPRVPSRAMFDMYVLSLQWPFSSCSLSSSRAPICQYPPPSFVVRGLWPSSHSLQWSPTCCSASFSLSTILDIAPALRRYWPDLQHADEPQLWRRQWLLHGSCSALGLRTYFKKVLELSRRYDFVRSLNSHGVVASANKPHDLQLVQRALDEATGGYHVRMRCERSSSSSNMLRAVHVCLHKTRFDTINCAAQCDAQHTHCCDATQPILIPYWSHGGGGGGGGGGGDDDDDGSSADHDAERDDHAPRAQQRGDARKALDGAWRVAARYALGVFALAFVVWLTLCWLSPRLSAPSLSRLPQRTSYTRIGA
eukprot:TRINITY_DN1174_c0_g2_i1.p1 TRINITY_DN1174_c0_g2~~TRINITY_DN1174_c0_g2_i1.p1  ORF type:complete len:388 (-),score=107.84 TRINITY_DN1174_c0_g2_i1:206-1330(-)